jgi:hypothetical protein
MTADGGSASGTRQYSVVSEDGQGVTT